MLRLVLRKFRTLAFVGAAAIVAASESFAMADSAQQFIQAKQSEVTALLHKVAGAQRDKQVASVLDGMIDYDELAKRSLGEHWGDLSDSQRKEFSIVLKQLVQRNYEKSLKSILDYKVEYLGEEPDGSTVVVHTRATSSTDQREEPLTIDYRLAHGSGPFRVIDVVTAGASLVNNYRSQFHRVIKKDGYEALLKRMKDKLAKAESA